MAGNEQANRQELVCHTLRPEGEGGGDTQRQREIHRDRERHTERICEELNILMTGGERERERERERENLRRVEYIDEWWTTEPVSTAVNK